MIKLQTQCHPMGHASACIAMLVDQPVETITADFHEGYHNGDWNVKVYLESLGVRLKTCDPEDWMHWGKVYLARVPSLNLPGYLHLIVVTTFNEKVKIYDPNEGYFGRKFYSEEDEPGAAKLICYRIDYEVLWCPAMEGMS